MPSDKTNPQSPPQTGPSVELRTNAVVVSYIHEISERHRRDETEDEPAAS